jgi:hypothetical protein
MNQNTKDQEWQQMQHRINKFVGHFLKVDIPAIEHKTRIAGLLQPPPEYDEQKIEEAA